MKPLTIKLFRDLWRLRTQSIAIALVIAAGVAMVVMSFGMIRSLEATRQAYYDRYRFADVFAPVRRAPDSAIPQIRAVPGVAFAEGRVSTSAILDVQGVSEPISAIIHSLPNHAGLNLLVLRSGRMPNPSNDDEAVVNEAFAKAARLGLGEQFSALLYGKRVQLRLVGTVLSPEYVYAVAPGQIFPDNRRYGIVWMNREPLAAALDLTNAFNESLVRLAPRASEPEVVRRLDLLLDRYGGTGAYGRNLQISDRFVSNEISQLATTVELLPPTFLTVAAFLLNIVLARLVDTEREVIGLMKAFGYSNAVVMAHYAGLALLLAAGGLIVGSILGTWLGHAVATMYQQYFVFPFLNFRAGADSYLIGLAATITAALIGAAISVRRAARLTPAEAMRPPSPPDYSGRWTSALAKRLGPDEPTRVVLRNLLRRPLRMTMTVIGLSSALALYIASASATDNIDKMIDLAFGRAERADLVVTFAEPRDARVVYELARMPGIMRVESFRAVGAKLIAGHHAVREALTSSTPGSDLSRLVDLNGRVVEPPPAGVIITSRMATQLNIRAGQHLSTEVTEGQRPQIQFNVSQVIDTPLGSSARLSKSALNRLMREGNVASGAYLQVDPLFREQIYRQLKNTPQIASVMSEAAIIQGVRDTVAQQMGIVTLFNTGLAALIVLGVVYNSARISLSEQARDLASMRVLGFRRGETAFVLLGELALLVLMSLPIGIAMGISLSRYVAERFSADLYTIPFGIHVATLAEGTLVVMAAALVTSLVIRIRVDNLDLVQALKTRE